MCLIQTVAASCLAYLDNGVVFVGALFGDSQLVKVLQCVVIHACPRTVYGHVASTSR